MLDDAPFWKTKSLPEMTHGESESLCDGKSDIVLPNVNGEVCVWELNNTSLLDHGYVGCAATGWSTH